MITAVSTRLRSGGRARDRQRLAGHSDQRASWNMSVAPHPGAETGCQNHGRAVGIVSRHQIDLSAGHAWFQPRNQRARGCASDREDRSNAGHGCSIAACRRAIEPAKMPRILTRAVSHVA